MIMNISTNIFCFFDHTISHIFPVSSLSRRLSLTRYQVVTVARIAKLVTLYIYVTRGIEDSV